MMTSSNGSIFRVTGPLCGEFSSLGEFPTQRPVTRSFDVFCDLRLNKRLSKQPWGWWFETPSWSLWRHCNVTKLLDFQVTLLDRNEPSYILSDIMTFSTLLAVCKGNPPWDSPRKRPVVFMFPLLLVRAIYFTNSWTTRNLRHHGDHASIRNRRYSLKWEWWVDKSLSER